MEAMSAHAGWRIAQFLTGITCVGEDVTQPWKAVANGPQHIDRPVAVLDIGGMNEDEDQEAAGVGQDMALAAFHLLARVIARYSAAFRGFHALAVDHSGAGLAFAPLNLAQVYHQHRVDAIEKSAAPPGVEVTPYR